MKKSLLINIVFALCILAVAGVCALVVHLRAGGNGAVALVSVADGEDRTISLQKDGTYSIDGGRLPVTLVVENGTIRFVDSVCPDHLCEGFGRLQRDGEQAICLPAGVVVTVAEDG